MTRRHKTWLRHFRLWRWLACVLCSTSVAGAIPSPPPSTKPAVPRPPMSALPKPPDITVRPPKPGELEELDAHLDRLTSSDDFERERAAREILEVEADRIPAIHRRLTMLAERTDKGEMKKLLLDIRDEARDAERKRMRASGKKGKVVTPDYLEMLLAHAEPDSKYWKELVKVVGMSRMLRQVGTVEAARELIRIYVRFGEFLRVDTQLGLEKMGEGSLAALIEAQRHQAKKIGRWAQRQLDLRGKAIPSETVQTDDHAVLADVLRAYGRIRDPDAARLIISFSNSERAQVREAARQAVAMLGEVGNWQLRDTYENIVGKKPPREWSWERTARELFTEFDRIRLSQVYELFNEGQQAQRRGDLKQMIEAFDKVLARSPLFEHRDQMVPGYVAYAQKLAEGDRDEALRALHRARRLADDGEAKSIESMLLTMKARELLDRKIADQALLRRAIDLDPQNTEARELLNRMQRGDVEKKSRMNRYVAAGAVGLAALLAIALILLRRPSPEPSADG